MIGDNMNISIRLETENDYAEVENITREAFWDLYKPGCNEHLLIHKLRNVPAFIKDLDYVACANQTIVGNIMYSKSRIISIKNEQFEVLCMGPLCVLPGYQKQGIGSRLLNESIKKAKELNFKAVVIFGDPEYYHRFGFKNAGSYNIQTSDGQNFDAFMALELYQASLTGIEGKFYEDPVFHIEENELTEFEKKFPFKEKHITETQFK
jgi:predicted N-acetyltransferase YhbS